MSFHSLSLLLCEKFVKQLYFTWQGSDFLGHSHFLGQRTFSKSTNKAKLTREWRPFLGRWVFRSAATVLRLTRRLQGVRQNRASSASILREASDRAKLTRQAFLLALPLPLLPPPCWIFFFQIVCGNWLHESNSFLRGMVYVFWSLGFFGHYFHSPRVNYKLETKRPFHFITKLGEPVLVPPPFISGLTTK